MARRHVKGTKQFNNEISEEVADGFRAFCKGRGESVREHLEMALQRHMDNPPPPFKPAAPPLPPVTAPDPSAKPAPKKKPKK